MTRMFRRIGLGSLGFLVVGSVFAQSTPRRPSGAVLPFPRGGQAQRPPSGQQNAPEIARWVPSTASASALAARADENMSKLVNVRCRQVTTISLPKRKGSGQVTADSYFANSHKYNLYFLQFSFQKADEIATVKARADGTSSVWLFPKKDAIYKPVQKVMLNNEVTIADWATQHPKLVLGGALGEKPLSRLLRFARSRSGDLSIKVQERVLRRLGVPRKQYRIVVSRLGAAGRRAGAVEVNVVVDGIEWLPVMIAAQSDLKGHEPLLLVSNISWAKSRRALPSSLFRVK